MILILTLCGFVSETHECVGNNCLNDSPFAVKPISPAHYIFRPIRIVIVI